jgi:hypothetical protein
MHEARGFLVGQSIVKIVKGISELGGLSSACRGMKSLTNSTLEALRIHNFGKINNDLHLAIRILCKMEVIVYFTKIVRLSSDHSGVIVSISCSRFDRRATPHSIALQDVPAA